MPLCLTTTLLSLFLLGATRATPLPPASTTAGARPEAYECQDEGISLLQRVARLKDAIAKGAPDIRGERDLMSPHGRGTMLTRESGIYSFGRPLKEGDKISLIADAFDDEHGFVVQFLDADGVETTEFKVQPQQRRVVRNAKLKGKWGTPVISSESDFPLSKQPSPVKIDLKWALGGWHGFVDGFREKTFDFSRMTNRPQAMKIKGTLVNSHVVLAEDESHVSLRSLVGSAMIGRKIETVVPHSFREGIEYIFPHMMKKGDSVHLTADGWESQNKDWSIEFHDKAGNVAFSWTPRLWDKVVSRNVMTKGFEPGSNSVWGLQETGGQWPFLYGTDGDVDVLFEWTWSFWATSVDGIRRPDLDFYHRTIHPITSVTLTSGLKNPKVSLHHASVGSLLSASRPDGCDAAGELSLPDSQHLALSMVDLDPGELAAKRSSGLHRVVGNRGVLVLTLARNPERLARAVGALGEVGIVPVPFPATDAKCASPEELDLGIRRAQARNSPSVALLRAEKAGQSPEEWWRETKVAQAIADSHRRALQAALARPGEEWTAILEDDAVPAGGMKIWDESFAEAWAAVPDGVKFVRLGWCGTGPPYKETFTSTTGGFKVGRWSETDQSLAHIDSLENRKRLDSHASDGGCTTAYVVHRSIIPRMLGMFPCTEAVDSCFLWNLFMTFTDEGDLWGAKYMANIDVDAEKLDTWEAAKHARRQNYSYIQAGVLQQARDVPSTRRLAVW